MIVKRDFPYEIKVEEDAGVIMPDGVRLSVRIWRPVDSDTRPVPAILEHLPYRKRDGTIARDEANHPWMAGHGYAILRVDMRGNGDSGGLMDDEYTPQELQDACDVIAWARAQPWCDGNIGMQGISWGGFNGLQVAALRPEGLKAIITICSTVDRFADDIHYKGGCQLGENLGWASQMFAYSARPPDPEITGDGWRDVWRTRLENQPFHLTEWLRHQRRDAYWAHGSVREDYSAIQAAVLTVGGWRDGYRNTPAHLVENLSSPVKGIIGPWIHKYPHLAGPEPTIGFLQESKRWWDHWLKGIDTGVDADPAMRMWLMDSQRPAAWSPEHPGRWIADAQWPSPENALRTLHLTDSGLQDAPGALTASVASPADCGAGTGEYFPFAFGPEFPVDQRGDDALSACFDTAPLTEDMDIVGAPRITVRLRSDQPQGQVIVRLCDVFPDGASTLISHGMLNLAHRDSHAEPSPVPPGESFDINFALDQIAWRVPAGHRVRIAISTAYWPFVWPSPAATALSLEAGRVDLPVRPLASGDEWTFEAAESSPPWDAETLRPSDCRRTREIDYATGESIIRFVNDGGEHRDRAHGLATSSLVEEVWRIRPDDPLSASAQISWTMTMDRGDWSARMETTAQLTAAADTFHIQAQLKAWEGDALFFEKEVANAIPRDNM